MALYFYAYLSANEESTTFQKSNERSGTECLNWKQIQWQLCWMIPERKSHWQLKKSQKSCCLVWKRVTVFGGDIENGSVLKGGGRSAVELYMNKLVETLQDKGFVKFRNLRQRPTGMSGLSWLPILIWLCDTLMKGYQTIATPATKWVYPLLHCGINDYLKWAKVFTALNSRRFIWKPSFENCSALQVLSMQFQKPKGNRNFINSIKTARLVLPQTQDLGAITRFKPKILQQSIKF